jgi:hypothetical protein
MSSPLPMHLSRRCHTQSKWTQKRCRAHAVKGWNVCRFHGAGGAVRKAKRTVTTVMAILTKAMAQFAKGMAPQERQ